MAEPINILHLRASNFVGGPEKQILEHCCRLDSARFRAMLCTFVEEGVEDHLGEAGRELGISCTSLPALSPFNPGNVMQLSRMIRENNIHILCSHGNKPNIIGGVAARFVRIGNIAISRGWTYESVRIKLYEAIDRQFLRQADHVVAVSEGQRSKVIAAGVPEGAVSVIHNAINLQSLPAGNGSIIREELGIPADAVFIASAGRLSQEKNYFGMIEAAKSAAGRAGNVYFAVFGEGALRNALQQQIVSAGLVERFFLPGFRKDMQEIFNDIDIFMLPSFTEGLPNVVLEAFAARKPVVASAVGGTPEIVNHGESGFLTTPTDVAAMTEAILALAADSSLRSEMGEAGYRHVAEHFTFEAQTRKYEELYVAIHNRRHAGA